MKFSALRNAVAAVAALSLAACGGGGGDSPASNSDSNSTIAIKSSNAKDVGTQSYAVLDFLNQQITNSTAEVTSPTSADLSVDRCKKGGNAIRTVNGDSVVIKYTNCDDGFQVTDGTATIQLSNLQNNRFTDPAWSATLSITFDNIIVKLSSDWATVIDITSTESGGMTVDYVQTALNVGTFHATTNSLQWRLTSGNASIDRNISQLDYNGSIDASNLITFNANFLLSGNLGKLGSVNYDIKTKSDFKRLYSSTEGYKVPSQGVMTVTAADKSALTFTAVDTTNVTLGVDKNGDSAIDDSIPTTWGELNSLLLVQF